MIEHREVLYLSSHSLGERGVGGAVVSKLRPVSSQDADMANAPVEQRLQEQ